jgi:hypothetical protein
MCMYTCKYMQIYACVIHMHIYTVDAYALLYDTYIIISHILWHMYLIRRECLETYFNGAAALLREDMKRLYLDTG